MLETALTRKLFGGEVTLVIYGMEKDMALPLLEEAYELGVTLQNIFNFYDPESELSILNTKRSLTVSEDLLFVLKQALLFCELSDGAYDISLGKAFLERKRTGKDLKLHCSYKHILIEGENVTLTHPDAQIDLGSIAKGYIADRIIDFLKENGVEECMVDARGDMRFSGSLTHELEIQHPREKLLSLCSIRFINRAIATSGDYMQYHNSPKKSHLLHQKELISITVIAPTLTLADGFATAYFVSDTAARTQLHSRFADIPFLTVTESPKGLMKTPYNNFDTLMGETT